MEAWKKEQLTAAGVDVHGALERFMGNEALLERMLQRFTGDANYAQLLAAADKRDAEEALRRCVRCSPARWSCCVLGTRTGLMPCCRRSHWPMSG